MKYRVGCDPGYANLGLSFVELETNRVYMEKIDLRSWNNVTHKLRTEDVIECILDLCKNRRIEKFFQRSIDLVIERLPDVIAGAKKVKGTNLLVRDVMVALATAVRLNFPHIQVSFVCPVSLKAFTGTGGNKSHAESKKKSFQAKILPPAEMLRAKEIFKSADGKIHSDPIEATECAMYIRDHRHGAATAKYQHDPEAEPRKFLTQSFSSQVIYPEAYTIRKKRLKCA